ncbi:hypothetical protein PR202_ga10572 [Eleusine coracana subsp. coracana]|uniref:Uncharacterized protein n=1 Tax=Eleusine coracana subsp. coracana TaxID=191504 RepID=A0AAV5C719_ELECO|nr:hypothetical protein PR202_ga10572 [Eleusine coracana subsp. coracana]
MPPKKNRQSTKASPKWKASPVHIVDDPTLNIPDSIKEFPVSSMDAEKISQLVMDGVLKISRQQTGWRP